MSTDKKKKKPNRPWRYEADCTRTEELAQETGEAACRPGWSACVSHIIGLLRVVRPRSTPLALHFIDLSAKEMLEDRHDNARLLLWTAFALANRHAMEWMQRLYRQVFNVPNAEMSTIIAAFGQAIEKVKGELEKLPEGNHTVKTGGFEFKVFKKATAKPGMNPLKGNPRLN